MSPKRSYHKRINLSFQTKQQKVLKNWMMNNEILLLNKKHADTLFDPTRKNHRETLYHKFTKQMVTSFYPPNILSGDGKRLLEVTSLRQPSLFYYH